LREHPCFPTTIDAEIIAKQSVSDNLERRGKHMKKEYDFVNAKRGPVVPQKGKTSITIYLDNDVLDGFRTMAENKGYGYQTMINDVLREVP
jgi:uncharacterized protein (DUF4415 family)